METPRFGLLDAQIYALRMLISEQNGEKISLFVSNWNIYHKAGFMSGFIMQSQIDSPYYPDPDDQRRLIKQRELSLSKNIEILKEFGEPGIGEDHPELKQYKEMAEGVFIALHLTAEEGKAISSHFNLDELRILVE